MSVGGIARLKALLQWYEQLWRALVTNETTKSKKKKNVEHTQSNRLFLNEARDGVDDPLLLFARASACVGPPWLVYFSGCHDTHTQIYTEEKDGQKSVTQHKRAESTTPVFLSIYIRITTVHIYIYILIYLLYKNINKLRVCIYVRITSDQFVSSCFLITTDDGDELYRPKCRSGIFGHHRRAVRPNGARSRQCHLLESLRGLVDDRVVGADRHAHAAHYEIARSLL